MTQPVETNSDTGVDSSRLKREMSDYQNPSTARSIWQLVNTLVPYAFLWYLAYRALNYSFWLMLPVVVVAAGFLIRTFIIFHDCGHRAFFRSSAATNFWGRLTGILTFTPFYVWSTDHAAHHATSGNLDKRGKGDIWMLTVQEYLALTPGEQRKYRLYRHPGVMFLLGPIFMSWIRQRIPNRDASRRERMSIYGTNLGILVMAALISLAIGWKAYLVIQVLVLFISHAAGIWLFYVQHQFEGVYWERDQKWDFVTASLEGGSFYQLPAVLRWFTGSIGYHHVHHLNSRIPNYNLAKCHEQVPVLRQVRPTTLIPSLKYLKYRLWDEDKRELVTFREITNAT